MPTYFITFFGMTVYVNISVIYPLIHADPSRPTYPLCVPTAWGIFKILSCYQDKTVFSDLRPTCTHRRIADVCFELHFPVTPGQFRSVAASGLHRRLALFATLTRSSFSKNAYIHGDLIIFLFFTDLGPDAYLHVYIYILIYGFHQ